MLLLIVPTIWVPAQKTVSDAEPFSRLRSVIENFGEDKILFASDYPHWDGLFPNAVSTIKKRTDISDGAKQKILSENAKRFYGWS